MTHTSIIQSLIAPIIYCSTRPFLHTSITQSLIAPIVYCPTRPLHHIPAAPHIYIVPHVLFQTPIVPYAHRPICLLYHTYIGLISPLPHMPTKVYTPWTNCHILKFCFVNTLGISFISVKPDFRVSGQRMSSSNHQLLLASSPSYVSSCSYEPRVKGFLGPVNSINMKHIVKVSKTVVLLSLVFLHNIYIIRSFSLSGPVPAPFGPEKQGSSVHSFAAFTRKKKDFVSGTSFNPGSDNWSI